MTKKAKKPEIENLIHAVDQSSEFFVIAKESGYLVVGTVKMMLLAAELRGIYPNNFNCFC